MKFLNFLIRILAYFLAFAFLLEPVLRLLGHPNAAMWVADKSLVVFIFFIGFLSLKTLVLAPRKESKYGYKSRQYQRYNQKGSYQGGYRQRQSYREPSEPSYREADDDTPIVAYDGATADDIL